MTSLELYNQVLLEVNDISRDFNFSKGMFITLYNKEASRWLSENISVGKKDSRNYKIQQWYVSDETLKEVNRTSNSVIYKLPHAFYDFVTSFSYAKKGKCSGIIINEIIKPAAKEIYLNDESKKPSFEWEESIAMLAGNDLIVYIGDYSLATTKFSYYKAITPIDIVGYQKADGTPSTTVNPDYDRVYAEEIASRVVKEIYRIYKNQLGFTLADERTKTDINN